MPLRRKPLSQSWKTFLENHVADLASVDFFVVPTATFRILFVFAVLLQYRRQVVHFNETDSPTAAWAGLRPRRSTCSPWALRPATDTVSCGKERPLWTEETEACWASNRRDDLRSAQ